MTEGQHHDICREAVRVASLWADDYALEAAHTSYPRSARRLARIERRWRAQAALAEDLAGDRESGPHWLDVRLLRAACHAAGHQGVLVELGVHP